MYQASTCIYEFMHVNVNSQFINCVMSVNRLHLHVKSFTFTFHVMYILRFILTFAKNVRVYIFEILLHNIVLKNFCMKV
jgi:hypothetical protein